MAAHLDDIGRVSRQAVDLPMMLSHQSEDLIKPRLLVMLTGVVEIAEADPEEKEEQPAYPAILE